MSNELQEHERRYYAYQTLARGLHDLESVRALHASSARWYRARLRGVLPPSKAARMLDVPCGAGNFLYFLKSEGYERISGLDLDPRQIEIAQALGVPARLGDAMAFLAQSDDQFDCISMLDFIEHVSKDAALELFSNAYARLAPGGVLIVRTPCADGPFGSRDAANDLTHRWAMTSTVLRVLFEMNGFSGIRILDERPQLHKASGVPRLAAFHCARFVASIFAYALGLEPPRVWSTSMWGVGVRPARAE